MNLTFHSQKHIQNGKLFLIYWAIRSLKWKNKLKIINSESKKKWSENPNFFFF